MPKLLFSNRFAQDLACVTSSRVENNIYHALDNIEAFAEIGSRVVPASIPLEFGERVRKYFVDPFDLVYTISEDGSVVYIEALIYARSAW